MSNCPQCQSEQTSSYRMLWMSGTASGNVSGIGVTAGGNVGVFGGSSSQQTYLAQSVAPPSTPSFRGGVFGCLVPFVVFLFATTMLRVMFAYLSYIAPGLMRVIAPSNAVAFGVGILCIFGSLVLRAVYLQWRKQRLVPVLETWERSWLCLICGARWVV